MKPSTTRTIVTPRGKRMTPRQYLALFSAIQSRQAATNSGFACEHGHFGCAAWDAGPCENEVAAQCGEIEPSEPAEAPAKAEATPIRITPALRKEVNAAVRANVKNGAPLAEVGLRGEGGARTWLPNALVWPENSDLGDLLAFRELKEINPDPRHPGCAELDLYVTTGIGINHRELETNVCVLIRDGHVVGATSDSMRVGELKRRIGFPFGGFDSE